MSITPGRPLSQLSRIVHREVVLLLVLSAFAFGLFLFTQAAAAANRAQQELDARAWFDRGRVALANGATANAVVALRRAAAGSADDWSIARTLASALVADGRPDASRQLLLRWRALHPDDAEVHAHLARVEARSGNVNEAVAYYESALHGRWPDGATERVALRREVIQLLLGAGRSAAALSHVLTMAANLPDTPGAQLEVAGLFMAAGDPARALEHYQRTLRLAPGERAARAGAGAAAFALHDYPRALGYVRGLPDTASQRIAAVAEHVVALDPRSPRLPAAVRTRRLAATIDTAARLFERCRASAPAPTPLAGRSDTALAAALTAFATGLTPVSLRETPEVIDRGFDLAARAVDLVAARCPPLDSRGEAVQRLARLHASTP